MTEHVDQLATDHANAKLLAEKINQLDGFDVNVDKVETNIVIAKLAEHIDIMAIKDHLEEQGILISAGNPVRFVTHRDVSSEDIEVLVAKIAEQI